MVAANEIPREELLLRDVGILYRELRRVRKENDLLNKENKQLRITIQAYESLEKEI
ncbi:hypothetical protein [Peribacillus simplex]|uniref:hypothetical protein n=1 Tax=Peribacillus simplex TaxID=1478 RepID=UPI003D2CF9BA